MDYENVIYDVDDRIARITLNRPEKRNTLNWPLLADLSAALKRAERDKDIRVIILKGAGPCFSSGHDLGETMGDSPLHKGEKSWVLWKEVLGRNFFFFSPSRVSVIYMGATPLWGVFE